jgi:hypothetical protein
MFRPRRTWVMATLLSNRYLLRRRRAAKTPSARATHNSLGIRDNSRFLQSDLLDARASCSFALHAENLYDVISTPCKCPHLPEYRIQPGMAQGQPAGAALHIARWGRELTRLARSHDLDAFARILDKVPLESDRVSGKWPGQTTDLHAPRTRRQRTPSRSRNARLGWPSATMPNCICSSRTASRRSKSKWPVTSSIL